MRFMGSVVYAAVVVVARCLAAIIRSAASMTLSCTVEVSRLAVVCATTVFIKLLVTLILSLGYIFLKAILASILNQGDIYAYALHTLLSITTLGDFCLVTLVAGAWEFKAEIVRKICGIYSYYTRPPVAYSMSVSLLLLRISLTDDLLAISPSPVLYSAALDAFGIST